MDQLQINQIKLEAVIGIHPWEQQMRQTLWCDLVLATDTKSIAADDQITAAIDYDKLTQHLTEFVSQSRCQLIETLVEQIADTLLHNFSTHWIKVTLSKPGALVNAKQVAISIERQK